MKKSIIAISTRARGYCLFLSDDAKEDMIMRAIGCRFIKTAHYAIGIKLFYFTSNRFMTQYLLLIVT